MSGFKRSFAGKKGVKARVEPFFIQGAPNFQITTKDISQASVGGSPAAHFDKDLGNVSTLDPLDLKQAHHQVVVRGDPESQVEATATCKVLTADKKGWVRWRPALCERS
jgi:hypothetical protein